jgi:hypothetical protein
MGVAPEFEFNVKKYIRNRPFSSWDENFIEQCIYFTVEKLQNTHKHTHTHTHKYNDMSEAGNKKNNGILFMLAMETNNIFN